MSEDEWLASTDVLTMLNDRRRAVTARKLRLFVAASCRQNQWFMALLGAGPVVQIEERWADGAAIAREMERAYSRLPIPRDSPSAGSIRLSLLSDDAFTAAAYTVAWAVGDELGEERRVADQFRCILGNPFRSVAFDPRWRTADTLGLARGIYEERAFDRLPLLADALMDAGCADEHVIGHCRSEGPHVRGCRVVDLVLGKE
jgi:hypothetical protein